RDDALIYDTHLTTAHARKIRKFIEALDVKRMRVVVSHCHLDHVAGNEPFADCEIIAHEKTLAHLVRNKAAIEAGTFHGPPPIDPLVLPKRTYGGEMRASRSAGSPSCCGMPISTAMMKPYSI